MKKSIVVLLSLCLVVCLTGTALALQSSEVIGRWTSVSMTDADGTEYAAKGDISIELKSDYTMCFPDVDDTQYTWEIQGNVIRLYNQDGSLSEVIIMLEDGSLLLDDGVYCFKLERAD